eukprot:jgi/Ulvmu1/10587/UM065_0041.1
METSHSVKKKRSKRDVFASEESKIRYEAYSRLQAAAVAFGEHLPIPEIVAIGGQSDGKSSLLEAFLGFRFNVREVEMGTRRPLIVQMVHDPEAEVPRCRLQNEENAEYGPVISESEVPETLKRRTEEHLKALGNATVSNIAICMRVEYAYCPNLTIIDTPGLILKAKAGVHDDSPDAIAAMVKEYIAPPHRLILFLQQSSVEWASSLWLHVVQEVDPTFSRTVMVCSKFDNRMREFKERWEVDKFLSASGYLPTKVKPFFVALPADRNIVNAEMWRRQINEVDIQTLDYLNAHISGGFDEAQFGARMGFGNLRKYLESELARRYRETAPATLAILQQRCDQVAGELTTMQKRLNSLTDAASLRKTAMEYAGEVVSEILSMLRGASQLDPSVFGMTTAEEHTYLGHGVWPGIPNVVAPPNASLKLFGGAAFERCLQEFQSAAGLLDVPRVARDKVANVLLAHRGVSSGAMCDQVAQQISCGMANAMLLPLLDAASKRLAQMLRRVFDIAKLAMDSRSGGPGDLLRMYVSFHASLQSAYSTFVSKLEESARVHLRRQLEASTSLFTLSNLMVRLEGADAGPRTDSPAWQNIDLDGPQAEAQEDDDSDDQEPPVHHAHGVLVPQSGGRENRLAIAAYIDGSPSKGRVHKALKASANGTGAPKSQMIHQGYRDGVYENIVDKASKLFVIIRQSVVADLAPSALKSSFLDPLHSSLFSEVFMSLFACGDKHFMTMFYAESAIQALTQKTESLARRAEGLTKCKNEFADLARCL